MACTYQCLVFVAIHSRRAPEAAGEPVIRQSSGSMDLRRSTAWSSNTCVDIVRAARVGIKVETAADVVFGVLWCRLFAIRGPVDDTLADELVALLSRTAPGPV